VVLSLSIRYFMPESIREAVVIGAGLAGGAAAIRLAQHGRRVLLLEKEPAAHDKVCGEFISADAHPYLHELGVDLATLDAARIANIRLIHGSEVASARLPFPALGLSRRVLDEAVLTRAQQQGVEVWRGSAVTAIVKEPKCWRIEVAVRGEPATTACAENRAVSSGPQTIRTRTIFLATGKHDLREWRRQGGTQNDYIGFKCHYLLAPEQRAALAEHVEMALYDGGYAGLEPVEDGKANLCLVVTKRQFAAYGKNWDSLLSAILKATPSLAERLASAQPCWPRPLSVFGIPYGFVYRAPSSDSPDLYRIGDQMAVIPSFSGYGMSIALYTAFLAVECHLRGDATLYHHHARRDVLPLVRRASFLSQLAESPLAQRGILFACRHRPGLIEFIARHNRIPALQRELRLQFSCGAGAAG
jgi:flavin-dependent dehydrogenase